MERKKYNRIVYIEPNNLLTKKENIGPYLNTNSPIPDSIDNLSVNNEDLTMSVDLQVIIPEKYYTYSPSDAKNVTTIMYSLNNKENRIASLMGGKEIIVETKEIKHINNELTTDYTDATYAELRSGKKTFNENLCIRSLSIKFDSNFYPVVTMTLVDVRGCALMMPSEIAYISGLKGERPDDNKTVNGSFFRALFHIPFPRFILTVKGYYGNPVSFDLCVNSFTTAFDSKTGDFNVTVKFIGYVYGLYTDLPFNLLIAAPYLGYNLTLEEVNNTTGIYKKLEDDTTGTMTLEKAMDGKRTIIDISSDLKDEELKNKFTGPFWVKDNIKFYGKKGDTTNGSRMLTFIQFFRKLTKLSSKKIEESKYTECEKKITFFDSVSKNIEDLKKLLDAYYMGNVFKDSPSHYILTDRFVFYFFDGAKYGQTVNKDYDQDSVKKINEAVDVFLKNFESFKNYILSANIKETETKKNDDGTETKTTVGWSNEQKTNLYETIVNTVKLFKIARTETSFELSDYFGLHSCNSTEQFMNGILVNDYIDSYNGDENDKGEVKEDLRRVANNTYSTYGNRLMIPLYYMDTITYIKNYKTIKELFDKLKKSFKDEEDDVIEEMTNNILGFEPTIRNTYRMIFAHIDAFMNAFFTVLETIRQDTLAGKRKYKNLGVGLKETDGTSKDIYDSVAPFPLLYKNNEENRPEMVFPGEDSRLYNIPEVKFVNDIIKTIFLTKENIDAILNNSMYDANAKLKQTMNKMVEAAKKKLQEEMEAKRKVLQAGIDKNAKAIGGLSSKVQTLGNEVGALGKRVSSLESQRASNGNGNGEKKKEAKTNITSDNTWKTLIRDAKREKAYSGNVTTWKSEAGRRIYLAVKYPSLYKDVGYFFEQEAKNIRKFVYNELNTAQKNAFIEDIKNMNDISVSTDNKDLNITISALGERDIDALELETCTNTTSLNGFIERLTPFYNVSPNEPAYLISVSSKVSFTYWKFDGSWKRCLANVDGNSKKVCDFLKDFFDWVDTNDYHKTYISLKEFSKLRNFYTNIKVTTGLGYSMIRMCNSLRPIELASLSKLENGVASRAISIDNTLYSDDTNCDYNKGDAGNQLCKTEENKRRIHLCRKYGFGLIVMPLNAKLENSENSKTFITKLKNEFQNESVDGTGTSRVR